MNMEDKKKIRKKMLSMRDALKKRTVSSASEAACDKIMALEEYKRAESIFLYIAFRNEISLNKLIEAALSEGKRLYIPVIENNVMKTAVYKPELCDGPFGTKEPAQKEYYDGNFDLSIIPAVACDMLGGRLGFGGGYYDKFLESKMTCKVAPIYNFQLVDELPLMPHDILMNIVIVQDKVLRFD